MKIYLASQSPRRIQILQRLGFDVILASHRIDEQAYQDPDCGTLVQTLASEKVKSLIHDEGIGFDGPILGADTLVSCLGRQLGKPNTLEEARESLRFLSGRTQEVFTALALGSKRQLEISVQMEVTKVKFRKISGDLLDWYLAQNEWQDAAGGYKIQEKGELLVEHIEGSFSNVMGLPISLIYAMLPQAFRKEG